MRILTLLVVLAISLAATACSSASVAETKTKPTPSAETDKLNLRRQIAGNVDGHLGMTATLEGPDQTVLVVTTQTWAKMFADKFMSNSWADTNLDETGLTTVRFRSRDRSPELVYDIASRSFTK